VSGRGGESWFVALLLLGFVALGLWMVWRAGAGKELFSPYSSYSPQPDGLKALYELLEQSGFKPQRFGETEYDYPQRCCMAVASEKIDPSAMFLGPPDVKRLRLWMGEGGRLLLVEEAWGMTAWSLLRELDGKTDPNEMWPGSGYSTYQPSSSAPGASAESAVVASYAAKGKPGSATAMYRSYMEGHVYKLPAPRPHLFKDVRTIDVAESAGGRSLSALTLLATGDPPEPVLLYRQVGRGALFWIARPELLANGWLNREDNHRLALATFALAAQNGPLYFDEHQHGYVRERRNAGSLLVQTTGGRLLILLGVAIALCFFGAAVRPARFEPQPPPPRRTTGEMVLAQASLYRRAGRRGGVSGHLVDSVRRAYMQAFHAPTLPSHEMLLAWVETLPQGASGPGRHLCTYLTTFAVPRNETELVRLARACDWAREQIDRARRG
jgi:hypothetical protein